MSMPQLSGRKAAWFLGVVALGVSAFFVFGGGPKTPKVVTLDESLMKVQAPALLPMEASKVSQVTLNLSGQRIVAVKSNGQWMLQQPYKDQANGSDIEHVIALFSALASDETVKNPGNTAEYGLNKPFAQATFVEDGQKREFIIGKPGKDELYYAKTSASNDIFLLRGIAEELTVLRPIDLVNRQLLNFNPDDVIRVEAVSKEGDIERVVERRDGKWYAGKGETGVVFEVEEFLRDLQFVNVSSIVSTGVGQGLSPSGSNMHIVLTRKDGKKHVLDVGNTSSDNRRYFVKSSDRPHIYQVVQFIAENLREKLRRVGTDMMGLNPDRVNELKLVMVDDKNEVKERVLSKNDGSWTTDGDVAFSVSGVLDAVVAVSAQTVAPEGDDATYGFNPAPNSVQINATLDNKAVIKLDLGALTPDGKYRYVRSSSRKGVYLAPAKSVDHITSALAKVRAELMVFDPAQVTRITVSESDYSGKTSSKALVKQGGKWMHGGKARSTEDVNTLLTTLKALGAQSIPPEKDEATYAFYPAAESWRMELTLSNGQKITLDQGATESIGSGWFAIVNYYVRISDLSDVVFVDQYDLDGVKEAFEAVVQ